MKVFCLCNYGNDDHTCRLYMHTQVRTMLSISVVQKADFVFVLIVDK